MSQSRHQGKWRYDFMRNGQRYTKSGFLSKTEAKAAEAEAVKQIGKTNTDFLKLLDAKLNDIQLKRTDGHYRENKSLFKKLIVIWGYKKTITRDDVEIFLNEVAKESHNKANKYLRRIKSLSIP